MLSWINAASVSAATAVVLAALTAVYVVLTWRLARSAKDSSAAALESAVQAARAADTAERALIADLMPLVIARLRQSGVHGQRFVLMNVGRATALNVVVTYAGGDTPYPPIDAGDEGAAEIPRVGGADEVTVTYDDAIGNRYRTISSLDVRMDGRMFDTSIHDGAKWRTIKAYRSADE